MLVETPISPAERCCGRAVVFLVALVLAFHLLCELEAFLAVPGTAHLFHEPTESAMRYFGVPHFLLALAFLLTSRRNRGIARRAEIGALLVVGAGICWAYTRVGGPAIPGTIASGAGLPGLALASVVYYGFVIHDLRDRAYFDRALNPRPPAEATAGAISANHVIAFAGLLVVVAAAPAFVFNVRKGFPPLFPEEWPLAIRLGLAALPAALWLAGLAHFARRSAAIAGRPFGDLLAENVPLLRVIAYVMLTLLLTLAVFGRPYAFIAFHFVSWVVFTRDRLWHAAPQEGSGFVRLWTGTPGRFSAIHLGFPLVLVVVGATFLHALGRSDPLFYLVSRDVFVYWTIVHVAVSALPR